MKRKIDTDAIFTIAMCSIMLACAALITIACIHSFTSSNEEVKLTPLDTYYQSAYWEDEFRPAVFQVKYEIEYEDGHTNIHWRKVDRETYYKVLEELEGNKDAVLSGDSTIHRQS